jgi:hypothetical protein
MPMVMMRCTYNWTREINTGIDRSRKQGLGGLADISFECPLCGKSHYLRRLYFEGDTPPPGVTDVYALDHAYGFAGEVGVLISVMALMEDYLAQLLVKLTNLTLADAKTTMGTFYNFSHRVDLLQHLAQSTNADLKKDISIIADKLRLANNLRVKYAHALYSVGKDAADRQTVHVTPFYGDARKKPVTLIMYTDDVAKDVESVKAVASLIHAYLYRAERPKR